MPDPDRLRPPRPLPRWRGWLGAALLALAPGAASALTVIGIEPPARSDAERSCYELAAEIAQLSRVRPGTPGFWARTDNQIAGVAVAITPVAAFGYLGYNTYRALRRDERAQAAAARIDELRRHSARRHCFVR